MELEWSVNSVAFSKTLGLASCNLSPGERKGTRLKE